MNVYTRTLNIFAESGLNEYFEENDSRIRKKIKQESENYILNVNENEYINYLASEFSIPHITIYFDGISVNSFEKQIPSNQFPTRFHVRSGRVTLFWQLFIIFPLMEMRICSVAHHTNVLIGQLKYL